VSRNVPQLKRYQCSRLGRTAILELEQLQDAHYPDAANRPEHFVWREVMVTMLDCRNKHQCGIVERTSGGWTTHWELCPAHTEYAPKSD
jgi:hypothetical protein